MTKCLSAVGVFSLAALIVAAVDQSPDLCFASLFWFLRKYATGCFGVFLGMTVIQLVVIGTIFLKLNKSHMVDPTERMAASRMIYYLAIGFLSNVSSLQPGCRDLVLTSAQAFIVPFFFSLTFLDQQKVILDTINLAMAATVVANVNGLMVTGLHLFLRSQNKSLIGYHLGECERKKSMYDRRDPRDNYRGSNHSLHAVNGLNSHPRPRSSSIETLLQAADLEGGRDSLSAPRGYGTTPRSPFSPKLFIPSGPKYPEPTQPPSEVSPSQIRKQQYSIFPQEESAAAAVLPATTYSPLSPKAARDTWKPPPIVKPWVGRGHKRDSSIVSTATVQIGIRLSNVDDFVPRKSTDTDVADLSADVPPVPPLNVIRPSPLAQVESRPESVASDYVERDIVLADPPRRRTSWDTRMKTLPPPPRVDSYSALQGEATAATPPQNSDDGGQLLTLSPTVYTPDENVPQRSLSSRSARSVRKLPSPMGVGFNNPGGRGNSDRSPVHAPPRPSGSAATTPSLTQKADWI